jgi:hypothetical protein
MSEKIHLEVIRSEDCLECRGCCYFTPKYSDYAPLFTDAQRRRALAEYPELDLEFVPHGRLWRVILTARPGAQSVCPLLDEATHRCRVYAYGVFDCDTWPYEIARRDGRLLLTLAAGCPVSDARPDALRIRGEQLASTLLARVRDYPERTHDWHDSATVLADLGDAAALLAPSS